MLRVRTRRVAHRCEKGVATLVASTLLAITSLLLAVVATVGAVAVQRAQAQTAADAAALAAAAEGESEAHALAAANGATVVSVSRVGDRTTVEVQRGWVTARATAERRVRIVPAR